MRIACVAFTKEGLTLVQSVTQALAKQGDATTFHAPARIAAPLAQPYDDLASWAAQAWESADALLFVGACGIAVRAIAPLVRNKYTDPAVVCANESGAYVIPLLSGHVGGANSLARRIGTLVGGQTVITTATDVRGVFAVDEWAASHNLAILDRDVAKQVSATLLEGRTVGLACGEGFFAHLDELPPGIQKDDDGNHDIGISISNDAGRHPFARTLRLVPRTVTVGVGCRRNTSEKAIAQLVDTCLDRAHVLPQAVCCLASIDAKANEQGLLAFARHRGWSVRFYSAAELAAVPGSFGSSDFVRKTVGVDNVCERAACAEGERLLLPKQTADGVTVALATRELTPTRGESHPTDSEPAATTSPSTPDASVGATLWCVGLGPGAGPDLTIRAHNVLKHAEVIVGYTTYVDLIRDAYPQAAYVATPMRTEVERCRTALSEAAAGKRVALVCSGDPGVYGMAGLLLELANEYPEVHVEIVPGVTAASGGAALLGAPLMHDWCCISLSDLMTPWDTIATRLEAAARADLCVCLYNPASRGRTDRLRRACDILLEHRSPTTACGIVRNVGRAGQSSRTLTLVELRDAQVDMLCSVFVGNSQTKIVDGRMVTPRGYLQREA